MSVAKNFRINFFDIHYKLCHLPVLNCKWFLCYNMVVFIWVDGYVGGHLFETHQYFDARDRNAYSTIQEFILGDLAYNIVTPEKG